MVQPEGHSETVGTVGVPLSRRHCAWLAMKEAAVSWPQRFRMQEVADDCMAFKFLQTQTTSSLKRRVISFEMGIRRGVA